LTPLDFSPRILQRELALGTLVLTVVGLGHIGLPLAVTLAKRGISVWGVDKDRRIVQKIRHGESPFYEPGLNDSLRSVVGRAMHATTNLGAAIGKSNVVVVCVPTAASKSGSSNLKDVIAAFTEIAKYLRSGQLVVLRSTVPPGTTRKLIVSILREHSELKIGQDFGLAFCPERLSEGNALTEITSIPQIVAGIDHRSLVAASVLFRSLGGKVVRAPSLEAAELAKMLDNIYRLVNIALANELALTSEKLGVDVLQAIRLSNTSPRTKLLRPGLAGGSCLTKDPTVLAHLRGTWTGPTLIVDASRINNNLVAHVLRVVRTAFGDIGKEVPGSTIAVLGLAYKSRTDDLRKTMTEPLVRGLIRMDASVRLHDPYVKSKSAKQLLPEARFSRGILAASKAADCVVIATDHAEYERIDLRALAKVVRMPAAFVDARSQFEPEHVIEAGFVYRGIGRVGASIGRS
jgi:nucleotide sugar dehydrogenase